MGAQAEDANGETLPFPLTLIDQAQGTVATSAVCPACQQWLEPCSHQLQAPAQPRNGRACIRHLSASRPSRSRLPSFRASPPCPPQDTFPLSLSSDPHPSAALSFSLCLLEPPVTIIRKQTLLHPSTSSKTSVPGRVQPGKRKPF